MKNQIQHREILENAIYTPSEISWLLKIGMAKTYELLRSDELKVIKLGEGQIRPPLRVSGKELLRYIHKE